MSRAEGGRRQRKLHWWNRGSGIRLRVWMLVNVVLLSSTCYGVYAAVTSNAQGNGFSGLGSAANQGPGIVDRLKGKDPAGIPDKSQLLHPNGLYFGAATVKAPYDKAELDAFTKDAGGIQPNLTSFFVQWNHKVNPYAITVAYEHGTVPLLTWEPWAGGEQNPQGGKILTSNTNQPEYRLANIAGGRFDSYITATARTVAETGWPVIIRFAHEMNGAWYPWSEKVNGNHPGDYVKAWRHVHDLFVKAGATNVIWLWSPNIVRPVPHVRLAPLYPGDAYVDLVGMTGYGVKEKSPDVTFGATLKILRGITKKPLFISETGAQIDKRQLRWVKAFFPFLQQNPDILGFVWMEKDRDTGARANWRFTSSPTLQQYFQTGLATLRLATGFTGKGGAASSASAAPAATGATP